MIPLYELLYGHQCWTAIDSIEFYEETDRETANKLYGWRDENST